MGREVRMVPKGWQHPKDSNGNYLPLLAQSFAQADADWNEGYAAWQRGEVEDYTSDLKQKKWKPITDETTNFTYTEWAGRRPNPDDFMPVFPDGTATMLMMYESTSEGTPISPAFETPEELARWLADNKCQRLRRRDGDL